MNDHRMFSHQSLAHQFEFAHELGEQIARLREILGFAEGLEIDTKLSHFANPQVAARTIQLVRNSC